MEQTIHNKQNGLDYTLCGDFYLPNLLPPQTEEKEIGVWGMRHLSYIKQHRKVRYINLLTTGKLNEYLVEIDERAQKHENRAHQTNVRARKSKRDAQRAKSAGMG